MSAQEIQALKPLALIDLTKDLSQGGERPSQKVVREHFKNCKFRKLQLGKLGVAVLMEFDDPISGPNEGSYTIYLHRNGTFSKIAEGGGFGPYVLTGVNGIPDLAFGSTTGACEETYVRLRYSGISYKRDACMQNVRDASNPEDCHPEPCDIPHKLPLFPEPDPSTLQ